MQHGLRAHLIEGAAEALPVKQIAFKEGPPTHEVAPTLAQIVEDDDAPSGLCQRLATMAADITRAPCHQQSLQRTRPGSLAPTPRLADTSGPRSVIDFGGGARCRGGGRRSPRSHRGCGSRSGPSTAPSAAGRDGLIAPVPSSGHRATARTDLAAARRACLGTGTRVRIPHPRASLPMRRPPSRRSDRRSWQCNAPGQDFPV